MFKIENLTYHTFTIEDRRDRLPGKSFGGRVVVFKKFWLGWEYVANFKTLAEARNFVRDAAACPTTGDEPCP